MKNTKVSYSLVTDWMGFTVESFDGDNCEADAIEYIDLLINEGKTDGERDEIAEELYIESYDENDKRLIVNFD